MSHEECIEVLGEWEGYEVHTIGRFEEGRQGPEPEVWIERWPVNGRPLTCSRCLAAVESVHDTQERWIQDLPILDARTWLLVHRCRVACPRCGPRLAAPELAVALLEGHGATR